MYIPKSFVPEQSVQTKSTYVPKSFTPTNRDWGKNFGGNVLKSGGRLIGDTVGAIANIFNPNMEKNTVANLGKLAAGTGSLLLPGEQKYEPMARAVGQFYKDRYGGVENIKNTLYNDPVGMFADAATVATGVGGALRGGGAVASKLGSVSNASKLSQAGRTMTNIGRQIDPLILAGKGVSKVTKPLFSRASGVVRSASDILGAKAQKFNNKNIEEIQKATKTDPLTFARSKNLPISATKKSVKVVSDATDVLQDQYDALVRTGRKISRSDYAKAIRAQADDLLARSDTPETRSLAKQLYDEAKYQMSQKNKPMTDSFLTDTKTIAFSEAGANKINNPFTSNKSEQIGRSGVKALEKYAPGSEALGKELRGYRTYLEQLTKQANTGKGTQLFNLFKPAGAGFLAGAGAGSFLPGIGNLTGAITGAVLTTAANSPQFLAKASNLLYKASKSGITLTAKQKGVLKKMYDAGRAGRMFTPTSQETPIVKTILSMPEFQEGTAYSEYTPKSDLLDKIAEKQGLNVEEMRKKRLNFQRK